MLPQNTLQITALGYTIFHRYYHVNNASLLHIFHQIQSAEKIVIPV
jgi:hypothetical protein